MGKRAAYRRAAREEKKLKTSVYNLTGEQIQNMKRDISAEAVDTAFTLLLTLPLAVLKDHYWVKTYPKKLPKFTEYILEYYDRWQRGELDIDELKKDLWEYAGMKIKKEDI